MISSFLLENQCAAYMLGNGVVGGDGEDGCIDGIKLTTASNPSCSVKCGPGYLGDASTVVCSPDAASGDAPTSSISCSHDGEAHMM